MSELRGRNNEPRNEQEDHDGGIVAVVFARHFLDERPVGFGDPHLDSPLLALSWLNLPCALKAAIG